MDTQSEKWKKYQVLFKYNLSSKDEIDAQIKRYSRQTMYKMASDIIDDMSQNSSNATYVIKIVPHDLRPKLTNYIVNNKSQLYTVINKISNISDYMEIWWCKTIMSLGSGLHGRFYINSGRATEVSQCIEQVWANTARKIESIGDGTPYLFAQRLWWGRRYQIEKSDLSQLNSTLARQQFYDVALQLEKKRKEFERFAQDAFLLNIFSVCFEYKLIGGRLFVVDWDSPNDKAILRGLL